MREIKVEFYEKNKIKGYLECEVAHTFTEKTKGLMFREKLSEKRGMFFSFTFPWMRTFWMKNVKIPLDIIFINRKKEIIRIYEAPVEKKVLYKLYWSAGFCKYVIETNKGFCSKNKIKTSDKIRII